MEKMGNGNASFRCELNSTLPKAYENNERYYLSREQKEKVLDAKCACVMMNRTSRIFLLIKKKVVNTYHKQDTTLILWSIGWRSYHDDLYHRSTYCFCWNRSNVHGSEIIERQGRGTRSDEVNIVIWNIINL